MLKKEQNGLVSLLVIALALVIGALIVSLLRPIWWGSGHMMGDDTDDMIEEMEEMHEELSVQQTSENTVMPMSMHEGTVGHIEFKTARITQETRNEWEKEIGMSIPDMSATLGQTHILLMLDNHSENLGEYDYRNLATIDGKKAVTWQELSNGMGGHHLIGILSFPEMEEMHELMIKGMSVGDIVISLE